jgi:hypothetical protein
MFYKGFSQFPLHPASRKIYSLLSDIGVFTPKRIIQCSTAGAHAFQAGMNEALDELIFQIVLVWIAAILVY